MRFNKVFRVFLVFLVVFTTISCKNHTNKELLVGVSPDYPPFAFEYRNELIGFDIDLVIAISERLGYKINFKRMSFDELLPALENKTVDLVISSVTKTPDRLRKFDFSESYYKPSFALVFKKEKLGNVHQVSDLSGVIGVEKSTTMEDYLDDFVNGVILEQEKKVEDNNSENVARISKIAFFANRLKISDNRKDLHKENIDRLEDSNEKSDQSANLEIKNYERHTELLAALQKDEVDAIFTEVLEAEVIVQNDRNLTYVQVPVSRSFDYEYGIAFQKGSKLVEKFNKVLNDIDSEGKIDILKLRWFSGYGIYSDILKK